MQNLKIFTTTANSFQLFRSQQSKLISARKFAFSTFDQKNVSFVVAVSNKQKLLFCSRFNWSTSKSCYSAKLARLPLDEVSSTTRIMADSVPKDIIQQDQDQETRSVLSFIKKEVSQPDERTERRTKVTVVGVGQVGMACAYSLLIQNTARELALVDVVEDKLKGEMMDMQHGLPFVKNCTIRASTDYKISQNSDIVVITAGARQRDGESRLSLVSRNVEIFRGMLAQITKYSPNCIILVVSNPVDVMTYVTWKLSGLPKERVIGSGTNLDSARFKFMLSERLNVAPISCHGWIIGEHGDSSVAVWSGTNIAGVKFNSINPKIGTSDDPEDWESVHKQVIDSAYEIIKLKGYTSWAIGLSVTHICYCILHDIRQILAVSVNVKGFHGISNEVYLSLPSVVGRRGVTDIINQQLTDKEVQSLRQSADNLYTVQQQLTL